mmetsp:Transcript_13580/g.16489  ORF Transcript_13580/g.16489 Transcript_13580/m.16489 type:complete len:530 (-) Transcript_13580:35-1624(-)
MLKTISIWRVPTAYLKDIVGGRLSIVEAGTEVKVGHNFSSRSLFTYTHRSSLCRSTQIPLSSSISNRIPHYYRFYNSTSLMNNDTQNDHCTETSIQVTQTSSSSPIEQQGGETQVPQQPRKLKKSAQQEAEEDIYNLISQSQQHYKHANYTEALAVSQEFLSASQDVFGTKHPVVASAYNNIGLMHKMLGEYDLSRENYHEALELYQEIVGKDHASYAATLNNLGVLDRAQCIMDDSLSILDRMTVNDRSVEYFEESLKIREVELGKEHVHTVTTRSNLGAAIASQVVQSELMRQRRLQKLEEDKKASTSESAINQKSKDETKTIANNISKYTKQKWDVAEKHLRDAAKTAIDNPRGEIVQVPSTKLKSSKLLNNKPKKNKKQTKVEDNDDIIDEYLGIGDASIKTLSAAAAAQNLAVFLKTRADLITMNNQSSSDIGAEEWSSLDGGDMYAEAKNLYIGALRVRSKLRGNQHPDTVATKFSLAELIDTLGDEDGANKLRQELLDIYEVEERDGIVAPEGSSDGDSKES